MPNAIHVACYEGNIRYLEKNLNKVNLHTFELGYAPIHIACIKGNLAIVKLLHSMGASLEVKTRDVHIGWTPLHLACEHGHVNLVAWILDTRLDLVKVLNREGKMAKGKNPIIKKMLKEANERLKDIM